jgi:hypothetical protein
MKIEDSCFSVEAYDSAEMNEYLEKKRVGFRQNRQSARLLRARHRDDAVIR